MVGRGGPSNWFGHCIDVELAIEGEKCSAGGVRSTLHKMAYPSLLKWSGSGLSSFMRPEWRLIRSVFDMVRVGEPAVGMDGRLVALLCDLPTASDFRAPVVLLHEF